jgi:hypothetical protein
VLASWRQEIHDWDSIKGRPRMPAGFWSTLSIVAGCQFPLEDCLQKRGRQLRADGNFQVMQRVRHRKPYALLLQANRTLAVKL